MTSAGSDGALDSVLDLEHALETAQTAAVDAEERLAEARREAESLLAAARERAERRAAERAIAVAAAADAEAKATADAAEAAAAERRGTVRDVEAAFVEAALAVVLPVTKEPT